MNVDELLTSYQKEIEPLIIHDFPLLCKVHFAFKSMSNDNVECFAALMEYLPKTINQDIKERVKNNNYYSPKEMFRVFSNLVSAVAFLEKVKFYFLLLL